MPEPRPSELRRLTALEARLEKTRGERARLATERTELRRAVTAAERAQRTAEEQITALVEENKRLADELEDARRDDEQLRRVAQEAKTVVTDLRRQLRAAETGRNRAEKRVETIERERDRLREQVKVLDSQVKGTPAKLVSATEAAGLVGDLIERLQGGLGGVAVREGEVRLRVAFGKVGRTSGLVLPTPESADELKGSLHDISIRFDRATLETGEGLQTG